LAKFQDALAEVARQRGAEYVDFPHDLLERRDDFLFVDFVHLNRHAHALLAGRLNQVIAHPPGASPDPQAVSE
jgi:lysophospholipase L1-like esterase